MEIEILSKKENELMERTEVMFKAVHPKEGTPQREVVREKVAGMLKAAKERVIVDSMDSEFGKTETIGYAKVYKNKEAAMRYEREPILVRNKLKEKAKAQKKAPAGAPPVKQAPAPAPAPAAAAPAAEKKPAEKKAKA